MGNRLWFWVFLGLGLSVWAQMSLGARVEMTERPSNSSNAAPALLQLEDEIQNGESQLNQIQGEQKKLSQNQALAQRAQDSLKQRILSQKSAMYMRMNRMYRKSFDQGDLLHAWALHGLWQGWVYVQKMIQADLQILARYRQDLVHRNEAQAQSAQALIDLQKRKLQFEQTQFQLQERYHSQDLQMNALAQHKDSASVILWQKLRRSQTMGAAVGKLAQTLAPTPLAPALQASAGQCAPIQGKLKSVYGRVRDAQLETETVNTGIEISGISGEKVLAARSGRVASIKEQNGWGMTVILAHEGGYFTVYAHLGQVLVGLDQIVGACQPIAALASEASPVLSFHVYHNRQHLDPRRFLRGHL